MKLKSHFESEILKKMQKNKYEELKKKLTSCS